VWLLPEFAVASNNQDFTMSDIFPHLDYKSELPQRLDHGVGVIGAGGIVHYAHLPAYKKAGFDELLRDSETEMIVDIAVYIPHSRSRSPNKPRLPASICWPEGPCG
jgi:hypothetical protein